MQAFLIILPAISLLGATVALAADSKALTADTSTLSELNQQYIRSVRESDVAWFDKNLAPNFFCTNPNGTIVNREQFLKQTAQPVKAGKVGLDEVKIRVMGDFALIHARVTVAFPDGRTASRRYTDAWARRDGRWLAVSAHITSVE